jgi:enoyl-CoA hydratase/carnithine racemase
MAAAPVSGRLVVDRPAAGVLRLTIDNAQRRNALDERLLGELADAIQGAGEPAVVIRGAGETFSAGYDLQNLLGPEFSRRASALVAHPHHRLFDALERSPATVIAEMRGAALGGGLELAICCDIRLAADDATVAMPAGRLGLTYSHTGLRRFVETIGLAATKELFLLGRRLDANRARELGIVNEVHSRDELEGEVLRAARAVTALSPCANAGNKRILERLREEQRALVDPRLENELETLRLACFEGGQLAEGVAAFLQGRDPLWVRDGEPPAAPGFSRNA